MLQLWATGSYSGRVQGDQDSQISFWGYYVFPLWSARPYEESVSSASGTESGRTEQFLSDWGISDSASATAAAESEGSITTSTTYYFCTGFTSRVYSTQRWGSADFWVTAG